MTRRPATEDEVAAFETDVPAGDFDFAVLTTAPAAAATVEHVRAGGVLASVVQVPEGANGGGRIRIAQILTADDAAQLQAIADAAGRGALSIPIAATFGLAEVGPAHRKLAEPQVGGKILVVP